MVFQLCFQFHLLGYPIGAGPFCFSLFHVRGVLSPLHIQGLINAVLQLPEVQRLSIRHHPSYADIGFSGDRCSFHKYVFRIYDHL